MNGFEVAVERLLDEAEEQGFSRRVKDPATLARIALVVMSADRAPVRKKKAKEARASGTFAT
jgi:hypothetical protein